jgi:hypothetical protein
LLIRGEKRDVPVRALLNAGNQIAGVSLVMAANYKVDHDLVARVESDSDPLVAVDVKSLSIIERRASFFDEQPKFI